MKNKIFISRYLSKVFTFALFLFDLICIFRLTGNHIYTAAGAAIIPIIISLKMGIDLLMLKAHSLRNSCISDEYYLQSCIDEVMNRSMSIGRKPMKVRLWIADNESLSCYTVGRSIVVNKSMLRLGDRAMLEGALSHELSHVYNLDSLFASLLEINLVAALCVLGLCLLGASAVIVLVTVIIFGLIFSSWIGFTAGTFLGKAMHNLNRIAVRAFYYICKGCSAFLYRRQEFESDRFAGLLGYSNAMISLINLNERMNRRAVQTSWTEDLLNKHPSDYLRIVQFERIKDEIDRAEQQYENNGDLPYNNPFNSVQEHKHRERIPYSNPFD